MSTTKILSMRARGEQTKRGYPVKASTAILQNQHIEVSTGYARPWPSTAALGLVPLTPVSRIDDGAIDDFGAGEMGVHFINVGPEEGVDGIGVVGIIVRA